MINLHAIESVTKKQRKAATPSISAFVMANAGSGKTRVLINRVARLLLSGTRPEKILCITFTKAAAAEMAERLFSLLGNWSLLDDDALGQKLEELEGKESGHDKKRLESARLLFAQALETPGGLKIQTIHAFCESILRRFPLEAGIPPGFTVIEEEGAGQIREKALDTLAGMAHTDKRIRDDFISLGNSYNPGQIRNIAGAGINFRSEFECILKQHGSIDRAVTAFAGMVDITEQDTENAIQERFINTVDHTELVRAADILRQSGKSMEKLSDYMTCFLKADTVEARWQPVKDLFLTTAGTPRKQLVTKKAEKSAPWLKAYLEKMQDAFSESYRKVTALKVYRNTASFYRLAAGFLEIYTAAKTAAGLLDFDDLVIRTLDLFRNTDNAWIMYRLDTGIRHILVDEAQDTSPAQWAVIEMLLSDYLGGDSADREPGSFFAVGDMKQSIYSFQGADVALFRSREIELGKRLASVTDYENVPLTCSFRTTEPVLKFIDTVFSRQDNAEGLGDYPVPPHGVIRKDEAGLVELWPPVPRPENPGILPWDAPVDTPSPDHPVSTLCMRIAHTIGQWLEKQEPPESENRPVRPGDIMILVQKRGTVFSEIIRCLASSGIPVAGADRLRLLEDPAVEDLLSYAKAALCEHDDLSLAEVLKSPLFGFDDDTDLFPLSYARPHGKSLWSSLKEKHHENPKWETAFTEISGAREVARNAGPYAFLSCILETGTDRSGRCRFYSRLGYMCRDSINEMLRQALAYENTRFRSLRSFIHRFENSAGDIRREPDGSGNAVRIMTVHGAKGLESDIVFLVDPHIVPGEGHHAGRDFMKIRRGTEKEDMHIALVNREARVIPAVSEAENRIAADEYEEYKRLFYVAATRARDRLYICGIEQGKKEKKPENPGFTKSWYALSDEAFNSLGADVEEEDTACWEGSNTRIRRIRTPQVPATGSPVHRTHKQSTPVQPAWLHENARPEKHARRITPSRPEGKNDPVRHHDSVYSPVSSGRNFLRGRILHRMLELLPDIEPAGRSAAAERLLAGYAGRISAEEHLSWRREVFDILDNPRFAAVFSPGSRSEVAIAGRPAMAPENLRISGQIDRLAVTASRVLIVDYKTNRPPPRETGKVNPAYVAQLAAYRALVEEIYPDRTVFCAILWTYSATLMEIPPEMLDKAFTSLTGNG